MGKTYCSWLLGNDHNNIIIISPTSNLAISNLVNLHKYSKNTFNPILISMDRIRDIKNIIDIIKNKNIFLVTYDSVDILMKIYKKINNKILFVDEYHNLSISNLEDKKNCINKLICNNDNKIFFYQLLLYQQLNTMLYLVNKYINILGMMPLKINLFVILKLFCLQI